MREIKQKNENEEKLNILLLEDYPQDAALLKQRLKSENPQWIVQHVEDKKTFERALANHKPDVILSDYTLPQYTGMDAFFTVQELGLKIPFILVTGNLSEENIIECVKQGVDDYVIKSSLHRLSLAIQNALYKKQQEKEKNSIAGALKKSENEFQTLFNHAGVAICELIIPNIKEIEEKSKAWNKADFNTLTKYLNAFLIKEANSEMFELFGAQNLQELNIKFSHLWSHNEMDAYRFIFKNIANGKCVFQEKAHFNDLKGGEIFLKTKFNLVNDTKGRYILTFDDLTDVKRSEKRLNQVIDRMENIVASRTNELNKLNEKLKTQARDRERINDMLRENFMHMTESIIAAKRIQQLMLPPKNIVAECFSDVFIYLRPKDIVSGDFYWFHQKGNKCWIAAVDCTGHGVPGAFMSMIGANLLNQAVIENKTESTAAILQRMEDLVVRELRQHESGTEISTGMDISLCSFDFDTMEMRFSGAFQNLYFIRDKHVEVLKGNRFSLGGTFVHKGKKFNERVIQLQKDDRIYMSTDGLMDQFGGVKNKKFMRKRFIELLSHVDGETMYDQEMEIKSALQDWKGTYEQVDDILVIGIRI